MIWIAVPVILILLLSILVDSSYSPFVESVRLEARTPGLRSKAVALHPSLFVL
jgi:hypothetical protein